jgi:protein tyrosine phosphatase (PTP) superfamily phosphohydrolase (DUF442 family)
MSRAVLLLPLVVVVVLAWDSDPPPAPQKVTVAGLHNVFRLSAQLYCGSGPEGASSFAALKQLGVKTIVSVDGAKPAVAAAKKYGLRYVHIPVGYNGISRDHGLQLAKAVKYLSGPFYIHCHHGKHRGPAAAAVALMCADEKCGVAAALAVLKSAGTDPRYTGLFKSVQEFKPPTPADLTQVPADLPETVPVAGLVQAMVAIDHAFDNLKMARAASWKTPQDHPDIDPPHEALQLMEGYAEMLRLPQVAQRPADFRMWASEGLAHAKKLEMLLRSAKDKKVDVANSAEQVYLQVAAVCTRCHAKYRDAP